MGLVIEKDDCIRAILFCSISLYPIIDVVII